MTGHKTLISMLEVAENRGESKRGNWLVEYNVQGLGEIVDLGYKKVEKKKGYYRIYHWGTLILEINELSAGVNYQYKVTKVYGQSVSDARGINAVLQYFGIYDKLYTYKPVNGGFQEVIKA